MRPGTHPARHAAHPLRRVLRGQGGGVLAFFTLVMPLYVIALGLVADAGYLFAARTLASAIADAAALAGVQELDLDRLVRGERYIMPAAAEAAAYAVATANLEEGFPLADRPYRIRVAVINAAPDSPVRHPVTGRMLRDPTVFVEVRVKIPLRFTPTGARVEVAGRADASVLPRSGRPRWTQ